MTWQRRPEGYTVYNLVVEDDHTYFVGNSNGGVWVHNPNCTQIAEDMLPDIQQTNPDAGIWRLEPSSELPGYYRDPATGIGNMRMGPPGEDWYYHDVVHDSTTDMVWDPMTSGGSTDPIPFSEWSGRWEYWDDLVFGPK